jgi:type II secretory pathway pseudopilin PulG
MNCSEAFREFESWCFRRGHRLDELIGQATRTQRAKVSKVQINQINRGRGWLWAGSPAGMTLVEVVIALGISGLAVGAIIFGYTYAVASADKSALILAASAKAMERLEQTRVAQWNISLYPPVDQLVATNFPKQVVALDLSGAGVGVTMATNTTQIFQISTNPSLKRIHVDCVWRFKGRALMTNSVETCRSSD